MASLVAQLVKNRLQLGRPGFDPWVVKIPGEGKGYPFQHSGLENSMDCKVHGVTKSRTRLGNFLAMAVKAPSPNHWTTREFLLSYFSLHIAYSFSTSVPLISLLSLPEMPHSLLPLLQTGNKVCPCLPMSACQYVLLGLQGVCYLLLFFILLYFYQLFLKCS